MFAVQILNEFYSHLERFSSLGKLTRVFGYILRFVNNCRRQKTTQKGRLSVFEINEALILCVRFAQQKDFQEDITAIANNKHPSARIRKLSPFLDESGLLRVGGRLQNSALPGSAKHPLLLSKESHLS